MFYLEEEKTPERLIKRDKLKAAEYGMSVSCCSVFKFSGFLCVVKFL